MSTSREHPASSTASSADILHEFQNTMDEFAKARLSETFTPSPPFKDVTPSLSTSCRRRPGAAQGLRRLSMSTIGCLPDNVQQAIQSFSIQDGRQHITIAFPHMVKDLRRCSNSFTKSPFGHGLFFHHEKSFIQGFDSFSTFYEDRCSTSRVLLLTLLETGSTVGITQHFKSLLALLLDTKSPLSSWNMPVCVTDATASQLDDVIKTCAQTVLDIQRENLTKTYPSETMSGLYKYVKENIISPKFCNYHTHLETLLYHCLEQCSYTNPTQVFELMTYIQSSDCSEKEFLQVHSFMQSTSTEAPLRELWLSLTRSRLIYKLFPASRRSQAFPVVPHLDMRALREYDCFHNTSLKDVLQAVFRALKFCVETPLEVTRSGPSDVPPVQISWRTGHRPARGVLNSRYSINEGHPVSSPFLSFSGLICPWDPNIKF
ncbi:uncharacterized protein LOC124264072 [Haliotis rubra]|uniref:uncharacterized protein LOC124264072 n=1 Tax=Haliotis rubra TaxID=36100 RepID=UPI001EE61287|nr:uncharacterized protein LOC124264072 [Haliotis rubra]